MHAGFIAKSNLCGKFVCVACHRICQEETIAAEINTERLAHNRISLMFEQSTYNKENKKICHDLPLARVRQVGRELLVLVNTSASILLRKFIRYKLFCYSFP